MTRRYEYPVTPAHASYAAQVLRSVTPAPDFVAIHRAAIVALEALANTAALQQDLLK